VPSLLVTELWGLGDLVLAVPFILAATGRARVTLVAKPFAAPIIARFAPKVELIELVAPWTAFRGKYRLHRWPWRELDRTVRRLRDRKFDIGVSARPDPRDHFLLAVSGAAQRYGFPRVGSRFLLNHPLPRPHGPHRADHWASIASRLGFEIPHSAAASSRGGKRVVMHTGASQPSKCWPKERFDSLASELRMAGWEVELLDDSLVGIDLLMESLSSADRFIGNDSGPGHVAALLGIPTFTVGPQLPEVFSPRHPNAAWIEGAACPFKPCRGYCRFDEPRCLTGLGFESVRARVLAWLGT